MPGGGGEDRVHELHKQVRDLFRSKVDGFVPPTHQDNLRKVREPTRVRQAAVERIWHIEDSHGQIMALAFR